MTARASRETTTREDKQMVPVFVSPELAASIRHYRDKFKTRVRTEMGKLPASAIKQKTQPTDEEFFNLLVGTYCRVYGRKRDATLLATYVGSDAESISFWLRPTVAEEVNAIKARHKSTLRAVCYTALCTMIEDIKEGKLKHL